MSLLLDALKKAAKQKAEFSAETDAELQSSDDTVLLDQTATRIASDSEIDSQYAASDNSQFDYSEVELKGEQDEHIVVTDEPIAGSFNEDETLLITDDDVTAFLGDETVLGRELDAASEMVQDDARPEIIDTPLGNPDDPVDEELSISLFDEDDSLTTAEAASRTGAVSEEIELELVSPDDITKGLKLAEVPGTDGTQVEIGRSNILDAATTAPGTDFRTLTEGETSTRTFAPDNYDRTLRKPGSDDISNLYAGVRSDTDVVMTPEFAKKMFRSNSSAQRLHNFKIYTGTAMGILVVVAVIGILEIEKDTKNIDDSLRHLKRDPMPGLIKNTSTSEKFTDVFAATPGTEVDAATLLIVENAESQVDTEEVVAVKLGVGKENLAENSSGEKLDDEIVVAVEAQVFPKDNQIPKSDNNNSVTNDNGDNSATRKLIQISSSSKISEKDQWLREAYSAYKRGDDETALAKYNAVLDLDPGNRNALLARAAIYIQNNRIPEAIRDYRTILIENPKDSLAMSSMIAVASYSPEQSETQLKLMIRDEPDSPYLNFALGNIFGAQNRWQEAQGQYFTALENNPNDPNYAYNLAISLEHIAKPKVAIAYYERALRNFTKGLATFNREVVDSRLEMLRRL